MHFKNHFSIIMLSTLMLCSINHAMARPAHVGKEDDPFIRKWVK